MNVFLCHREMKSCFEQITFWTQQCFLEHQMGEKKKKRFTYFHLEIVEIVFLALNSVESSLPPACLEVPYFQGVLWILSPNRILKASSLPTSFYPTKFMRPRFCTGTHFKPSFFQHYKSSWEQAQGSRIQGMQTGNTLTDLSWKSSVPFTCQKLVT